MSRRQRTGFTIMELLVTIGILVVLCACLIAAVWQAREYGARAGCLSNHRQIMLASRQYCQDWNGMWPATNWDGVAGYGFNLVSWNPSGTPGHTTGGEVPVMGGWLYTPGMVSPYLTAFDQQNPPLPYEKNLETSTLWPYLSTEKTITLDANGMAAAIASAASTKAKSYGVFRCPADTGPYNEASAGSPNGGTRRLTSYIMNGAACGYTGNKLSYKVYQMRFAGDGIAMWECDEHAPQDGITSPAGGFWNDGGSFPWEGCSARHHIGASVSCYDGHSEWIAFPLYYSLAGIKNGSGGWATPPMPAGYNRMYCNP